MATFVALLRAVNVGGTGKLPMTELRALCVTLGFTDVRTYIASGNVVFGTRLAAPKAKAMLETALLETLGKPCRVLIRTADQLEAAIKANPFPEAAANQLLVLFLDTPPDASVLKGWRIPGRERLALHGRELFVHFPDGMGPSKLKIPFADEGTGRNLNTVRTLVEMARVG
jgi:uncharacterized protein (DUF1697 family)